MPNLRLAPLLAALLAFTAGRATAQFHPFDRRNSELAREASRDRSPAGVLPLIELYQDLEYGTPASTIAQLEQLSRERRLPVGRRAYAAALLARARFAVGDLAGARAAIAPLGYVRDWQVIGPFDNEGKQGFAEAYPPELRAMERFDPDARYPGREAEVSWRRYPDPGEMGLVDFDALFRPFNDVCGYAQTVVHAEEARDLALQVGGGGATKIWWNGELVHEDTAYRNPDPDRHAVLVGARAGANRVLVKSCITDQRWGFFLRLTAPDGTPALGTRVSSEPMELPAGTGHREGFTPRTLSTDYTALEAAAEATSGDPSAAALYRLARFLLMTGADDATENRARQVAARAAELAPEARHLELAARTASTRGERMTYARRASEAAPNDMRIWLLRAQLRAEGFRPEEALPWLDRIDAAASRDPALALRARVLRANLLAGFDLPRAAHRLLAEVAEETAGSPFWLTARAEAASGAGLRDEAIALRAEAVAAYWDDRGSRRVLIADAIDREENEAVVAHLEAIRQAAPSTGPSLRYVAAIYEAIGQHDEALDVLRSHRELAPRAADTRVALGRMLMRQGQDDAAEEELRAAIALRPQDAETRELLEQIQPQERLDEAYAVEAAELLARRVDHNGFPTTTLQQLTVNTVYPNGLGSSFHQSAFQIHDEEGARQLRTFSIQYDPGTQRVDLRRARVFRGERVLEATELYEQQLGEPWYRIYYDTRAKVVVFPDLEPGDTVEVQWRVDDVAHRNLFADYYGDLSYLQGRSPIRHLEYVLITPRARGFYFNEPRLAGLQRSVEEEGERRVYRFYADDVSPLRGEPSMPGATEILPYLHVSTYESWHDVGRWYWGLIQDQLQADDNLRGIVADLVRGKESEREKVIAIHDWVVENTRYVGLEFGIHGFKPYRVPDIVRRGFGDCKDKASLLFVMFREAGIDAHIVLTRTRRNGAISDLPASLAVFDHAIAYVPGLDLYIDGTAEHSGITELPGGDQGVTVLHVWPEGSELRQTPVLGPEHNARERSLEIEVTADGNGVVRGQETVVGSGAPGYRVRYQAEGTRAERFEESMRGLFPGLHLDSIEFQSLDSLEEPVRFSYVLGVPQLAQRDGSNLRIKPNGIGQLTPRLAGSPNRSYPLDLGGTSSYSETRTLTLPRGARVDSVPAGGEASSRFGTLRLEVESLPGRVQTRTELRFNVDRVEPGDYHDFRAWVQEMDLLLRQRILVTTP